MTKILMTGGGAPGAPGILKCLKKDSSLDVYVCDANENATGKHLNEKFFPVPKANDANFANVVLEKCLANQIQIVLPLVTRELFVFAREKKMFESKGIKVLVSDELPLNIANDKSRLYEFLRLNKIEVPNFRVVNTVDQFEKAAKDLGYPQKKFCFKPSVSNGSRGFRIVDDDADEFDLLFNHKPNSTYISYSNIISILSKNSFPQLLLSEVLPGEEYSVDCVADKGKCKIIVPRIRSKMINGISVEGEFIENKEIIDYSEKIIEAIGLHGNIGVQVKKSETGKFLILEINPRVQGTIVSALGAGVNLPLLAVKQELGLQINPEELQVKWGTKFSRFWDEVFYT
ncbi:MAG: ATP-grasp domain-containing protein [Bacteroidia bacterium]